MYKTVSKILILVLILGALSAFFIFDLHNYANLTYIKEQQEAFTSYYQQHTWSILLIFSAIYVLVTALSLPAATILTLLGGALFGFLTGLIIISFASTIGATLAFLMARFIGKDYIQGKYSTQLAKINQGFAKEGAFYLFALRLVPLFPFFMINIVMGLLPIRAWTFYWVSQLGMLPGTAVYVYAGTQLAQIESLSDITSPTLLLAFALLGLLPLMAKKLVNILRKRKAHETV